MKRTLFAAIAVVLLLTAAAFAEDTAILTDDKGFNLAHFRPNIFGGHYLAIEDSAALCPWTIGGGLYYEYVNKPFSYYKDSGTGTETELDYIGHYQGIHGVLAFGLWEWMSLGATVPYYMARMRPVEDFSLTDPPATLPELSNESFLGDVKAEVKFMPLDAKEHVFGIAIAPYVNFPTAPKDSLFGEGRTTGGGNLILGVDTKYINFMANGGYLYRGKGELMTAEMGDAVTFGAGIGNAYDSGFEWSIEGFGSYYFMDDENDILKNNVPVEVLATLRYRFGANGPRIVAAGGTGLSGGPGAGQYRVVGGIDYFCHNCGPETGVLTIKTVDQNNKPLAATLSIVAPDGKSQTVASTGEWNSEFVVGDYSASASREGYQGDKRSASLSADGAVITLMLKEIVKPKPPTTVSISLLDKCSNKPVKAAVVLKDGAGKETAIAVGENGYQGALAAGTYQVTISADGYQPKTDSVTLVAEKDTPLKVVLIKKIELKGTIFFAVASDKILAKSFPVIDDAAEQIKGLCQYSKIRLEGYTSSEGKLEMNNELSKKRAAAVKAYLVKKGIPADKLESEGYGPKNPVAPNDTEANRAKNRRVEFIIVE